MTGSAADADDLVQDTFTRAMERPPPDTDRSLRPWLVRVAMNLSRDRLRRRKRRTYVGPWLPSPIEAAEPEAPSHEARYGDVESASFAFLIALEALTPNQRAVLILRDVAEYSVEETADALAKSASNVKTTHHRARRVMQAYDESRRPITAELQAQHTAALQQFLFALASRDTSAMERLLADDARTYSDAGGEVRAAVRAIVGPEKIARFFSKLAEKNQGRISATPKMLNGLPGFIVRQEDGHPRDAEVFTLTVTLTPNGRIGAIHLVLAPSKLTACV